MARAARPITGFLISRRGRGWRWALAIFALVVAWGLDASFHGAPARPSQPSPSREERLRLISKKTPRAPAPVGLQTEIETLATGYGEPVGIAVADLKDGWIAKSSGEVAFPQQSVSKIWVAIAVLDQVDHGAYRLEDPVVMGPADLSVFYQPVAARYGPAGFNTTWDDLLARALIESDNAAADRLVRQVGGAAAIQDILARKKIVGIDAGGEERELQARIAGLAWRPEYGFGGAFKAARARLSPEARDAAMAAYLADPPDGATPVAVVKALAALQRGELLSETSTDRLISLMQQATTGPRRLKGGLPPDWTIAHKTGTGQDWRGASTGINDVGLITAPDGRVYAVAVMIRRTAKPVPERLAFMQSVSAAIVRHWVEARAEAPPY
jgi:beta-lactamase class A